MPVLPATVNMGLPRCYHRPAPCVGYSACYEFARRSYSTTTWCVT